MSYVTHFADKFDDFADISSIIPDKQNYFLTIWLNNGLAVWCKAAS